MKLSLKMSLLTIGLLTVTLLLSGVIVLRSVYAQTLAAAQENARSRIGYLADAFAFASDWEGEALSERAQKSRLQYLFRRLETGEEPRQLTFAGETLFNSSDLALDTLLGESEQRLIESDGRYGIAMQRTLDNGCRVYLLYDCTDMMRMHTSLTRLLLAVGAVSFVFVAAAALLLTHAALSPLKELERAARRMADGDYDTPIPVRHHDEVGSLAQSFETMRGAIRAQLERISAVAEERQMLLGALTHEMKTPMTAIVGYSEAITTLRLSEAQREESIRYLHRESKRLEQLTQKMMRMITLDGGETIENELVRGSDLDAVLRPMLTPIAERGGVTLAMDLDGFAATGDADLLSSVLTNLFDNAASAGAKHITLMGSGGILTVSDDGIGMTPEVLARITEPFYRADKVRGRAGGHAGLGLALVQRIITLHGGTLSFASTPGKGTTATVSLPPIAGREDAA